MSDANQKQGETMKRFFVYFTIFMFCFLFAGNNELKADNIKQIGNLQWSNKTPFTLSQPEAKNYCQDLREGGHNDWRLPTISELRTLIQNCPATETNGDCKVTDHFLSKKYSNGCFGCIRNPKKDINYSKLRDLENLWSSSSLSDNPEVYAFYVDFQNGRVTFSSKINSLHARCVRNSKPVGIEEEKKISIKTFKEVDTERWSKRSLKKMDLNAAKQYCANLNEDENGGWRLPNIDELRTLIKYCPKTQTNGACNPSNWDGNCYCYDKSNNGGFYSKLGDNDKVALWSSSYTYNHLNHQNSPLIVSFNNAGIYPTGTVAGHLPEYYVRCFWDPHDPNLEPTPETLKVKGLPWSEKSAEKMNWNDAVNYCSNLNEGGYNNWRLPNIDELRTLIENCPRTETDGECGVTNSCLSSKCRHACGGYKNDSSGKYSKLGDIDSLWSSSSVESDNSKSVWKVSFDNGSVYSTRIGSKLYARCVRDSNNSDSKKTSTKEATKTEKLQWSEKVTTNPYTNPMFYNDAVKYCKNLNEGSYSDWRLPNIDELRTLIKNDADTQTGGSCPISEKAEKLSLKDFTENCIRNRNHFSAGKYSKLHDRGSFCSSSISSDPLDMHWCVDFNTGGIFFNQIDNNIDNFRCVRNSSHSDSKKTSTKSDDSKNKKEATKTEKLQWSDKSTAAMNWDDAMNYCKNLNENGHSDWRLPNIDELRTLIQNCPATVTGGECKITDSCLSYKDCFSNACNTYYDSNGGYSKLGDTYYFWSSSVLSDNSDFAWYVDFNNGYISPNTKGFSISVRCVR